MAMNPRLSAVAAQARGIISPTACQYATIVGPCRPGTALPAQPPPGAALALAPPPPPLITALPSFALTIRPHEPAAVDLPGPAARLVGAFLAGRSPQTLRAYRRDMQDLAAFLG